MSHTQNYLESVTLEEVEVETLVNYIVLDSVEVNASDIHIEPWEETIAVRIRIAGVLTELIHLPLDLREKLPGRFKVMGGMASHISGIGQDGKANMGPEFGNIQLRISILPTIMGEKVVCRVFDPSSRAFDINQLGFEPQTLEQFVDLLNKPNGLILLNGPTGSGKTTAMYSALMYLIQKHGTTMSIATVEDPVEVPLATIAQAQLQPANGFGFAAALRSLMRQDPEVIMVGEIRDPETAGIAIQAGLTGHLVISTVHSGSTAGVFARLINMNIEPFLLASSIMGILGVRLVRKNCDFCAIPYEPDVAIMQALTPQQIEVGTFRRGEGCEQCSGTGYGGRMSLTELLRVSERIRDAVLEKRPTRQLVNMAIEDGMRTLWDSGVARVLSGETTLEEVAKKTATDQI
ncbi:MAG: type II/IV secretion system protein [Verrucomicrobiae bacterium]|jgi:type II secretory ATPase GspE/PulE/Tfp pilus assembly ATPase PilB-like protein|nr:type II/IV secretion system protein [Verrucomicrobiae bacterium]